jgi:hypothetical protein
MRPDLATSGFPEEMVGEHPGTMDDPGGRRKEAGLSAAGGDPMHVMLWVMSGIVVGWMARFVLHELVEPAVSGAGRQAVAAAVHGLEAQVERVGELERRILSKFLRLGRARIGVRLHRGPQ